MSTPTHVVHVLSDGDGSGTGIAHTVTNLVRHVDPALYSFGALFLGGDGPLGDELRAARIPVKSAGWRRGWRDIAGAARFAGSLRESCAGIVHLHAGGMSVRIASKVGARARVVAHYHSLEEESGARRGSRRSGRSVDMVLANSKATAATVHGFEPIVVYPGVRVSPRSKPRRSSGPITIGTVARLAPVKGIGYLISAMKSIVAEWPDTILQVAGEGSERHKLERDVRSQGIARNVTFLGWRDDVSALMSDWDIYVQPSLAEGAGISVLEAMAAGLPVVASAVGGLPEIVEHAHTGFLVPPRDSAALSGRLADFMRDPALRIRVGDAGRNRARLHFSLEREADVIRSVYEMLT